MKQHLYKKCEKPKKINVNKSASEEIVKAFLKWHDEEKKYTLKLLLNEDY